MIEKPAPVSCAESLTWLLQRITDRVATERERREQRTRVPVG